MKNRKGDVTLEQLIALIIILIVLAVIVFFILLNYSPTLSNYVGTNIIGPLGGGSK